MLGSRAAVADDRWRSCNGGGARERRTELVASSTARTGTPSPRRLAQDAAGRHAAALCDEIDRNQQQLVRLRAELEGAAAVCRALLDDSSAADDFDALARAERILRDTAVVL